MKVFIVTGASRGIGEALAQECAGEGHRVITISRSAVPALSAFFAQKNTPHQHLQADLSQPAQVSQLGDILFGNLDKDQIESLVLINNAGMLEPIGPAGKTTDGEVIAHIQLNLLAPMLLTSTMIRHTATWNIPKIILNISSGAAFNAYYGWSAYCSGKAGLTMYTKSVALEQQEEPYPVRIFAIGPGVVDTQMQDIIRSKSREEFRMLDKFIELKEKGYLQDPASVAKRLMKVISDPALENGFTGDLRDIDQG
jgi:benzil reductase ((S)-benzoin forming)